MNHPYFDYTESADNVYGGDTGAIITLLAGRFIGTNPETPYVYRAYHEKSIPCNTRAQYIFDFEQQFPGSPDESIVWAAGELWRPGAGASAFLLSCFGPVQFFINEERVFSSTGVQEGDRALTTRVPVTLLKGCNIFVIRCEKTATGFGCTLSNAMPQWEPCNFLSPFAERSGRAGFVFTPPMAHDPFAEGAPQCNGTEEQTGLTWLPEKNTPLKGLWEVFNGTGYGYAWTVIDAETKPLTSFNFQTAKNHEPEGLWLEGQKITPDTEGNYTLKNPGYGRFNILVCTKNPGGKDSAFSLRAFSGDTEIQLSLPVPVKGARGSYLYAGLFPNAARTPQEIMQLTRPFKEGDRLFFWRTQEEQVVIRPFVESPLY
ncbi:MAG: hypothetical protein LBN21_10935, partial [Treponema sp.]|nr:hypothetical protein [Treponema sp.]